MIGKVAQMGSHFLGALEYCYFGQKENGSLDRGEIRGEVLFSQHLDLTETDRLIDGEPVLDLPAIADQMNQKASQNGKLEKPVWHQSFSFPPGEDPSPQQIEAIVDAWKKRFGFEHNQLIIFRHTDKDHAHFHIIANRADMRGINTSIKDHNYRETARLCRSLEQKLGLTPTPHFKSDSIDGAYTDLSPDEQPSQQKQRLKDMLDAMLPRCESLTQLQHQLYKQGYKTIVGRGITFVEQRSGQTTKGSALGREYSLQGLTKRLGQENPSAAGSEQHTKQEPVTGKETQAMQQAIDHAIRQSGSLAEFRLCLYRDSPYQALPVAKANQLTGGRVHAKDQPNQVEQFVFARQFGGGLMRYTPDYRLGPNYTLSAITGRIREQGRTPTLTNAQAQQALSGLERQGEIRHLQKSIDYHLGQSRNMTDFVNRMEHRSRFSPTYIPNAAGPAKNEFIYQSRLQPNSPPIQSSELGSGYSYEALNERMNLPRKQRGLSGGAATPTGHSEEKKAERSMPIIGGAQMDRDTKRDLAEIESSLQQLKQQNRPQAGLPQGESGNHDLQPQPQTPVRQQSSVKLPKRGRRM